MIANDVFTSSFGIVPAGDDEALVKVAKEAVRNGFAIVVNKPGGKEPVCTLTAKEAKEADNRARDDARGRGDQKWMNRRHECAIYHAITDVKEAERVVRRLVNHNGTVNLGVEVGRSRYLVVDVDTAAEKAAFLADWSAAVGHDMSTVEPTVLSPGKVLIKGDGKEQWVHKDGGHYWFSLPEGVDLAALPGGGILTGTGGWVAIWSGKQVIVPPSVRAEGPYVLAGQPEPAPQWLLDRVRLMAEAHVERKRIQQDKVHFAHDPIDEWSVRTPWAELLEPDGWTATGLPDTCDCPIWTRPGDASHFKSATAHELGCQKFEVIEGGHGPLHLWTDNPPEFLRATGNKTFSKLQYAAHRDFGGDAGSAMRSFGLAALGGGSSSAASDELWLGTPTLTAVRPDSAIPTQTSVAQVDSASEASVVAGVTEPTTEDSSAVVDAPPPVEWPQEIVDLAGLVQRQNLPEHLIRLVRGQAEQEWAREEFKRLRNRGLAQDIRHRMRGAVDRLSDVEPDDEQDLWRIEQLWLQGQVVMLTAQWKAGKTTMVTNVVRSLADGTPFLGKFGCEQVEGNIFIVNAEMTRRQFNRWLFESPVQNREKVYAFHVREAGPSSGDILDQTRRDELVEMLNEVNAQVLIMDPLNPLISAAGLDENASTDVAKWFTALADIQERTTVTEVFLVHHFGHNGQRGRGSSKFMDAPDALWTYVVEEGKEKQVEHEDDDDMLGDIEPVEQADPRYLSAVGRDVELHKTPVLFDKATRTLSLGEGAGMSPRQIEEQQKQRKQAVLIRRVVKLVHDTPGLTGNAIKERIGGRPTAVAAAVEEALRSGQVRAEDNPKNRGKFYHPPRSEA